MNERPTPPGFDRFTAWRESRRSRRALERAREPLGQPVTGTAPDATRLRRTRRQQLALIGLVTAVVFVGLAFVGAFPVSTWWSQRSRTQALEKQVSVIDEANQRLEARARELKDPATIARIARQNYGMVRQGERSYALLPPPRVPVTLPPVWPFVVLEPEGSPGSVPATTAP